jgi:flavin reductase (DIM6/NTAB) family NADH-FMN oxidoreductase RutF
MVAGWGGWGVIFSKPATFLMLRSNRYTLELMRKERSYTMAFFDEEYKGDIMEFGKQSGRDSDAKMKNTKLTAVQTPAGNMTFKEAKLIIECKLVQVTTVAPEDFYTDDSKKFVTDAYAETNDYHKVVFGEITGVWVRK